MQVNLSTINFLVMFILAAFIAWSKWQEYKTKKRDRQMRLENNIPENPTSCKDHEERLRAIEKELGIIAGDIKAIKVKLGMEI